MFARIALLGLGIWAASTALLRLAGHRVLHANATGPTLALYALSFVLMAFVVRRICRRLRVPTDRRLEAAAALSFPTLVLDPFSCAFFATVFPNIDPAAGGVFGGWMLICCAGAIAGAWKR